MDVDSLIVQSNDVGALAASGLPLHNQIAEWRAKQQRGELTKADMREIVLALRAGRSLAASRPRTTATKAKIDIAINTDDLLKGMGL